MQGKPSLLPTPAQPRVGSTAWYGLCRQCRPARRPGHSGSGPRALRSCLTARARGPEGRGLRARAAQTPPSGFPGPNLAPAILPRAVPDWPASGSPPFHWSGSNAGPASAFSDWFTSFPGSLSWEEPPGRGDSRASIRPGFRHYCACVHLCPATGPALRRRGQAGGWPGARLPGPPGVLGSRAARHAATSLRGQALGQRFSREGPGRPGLVCGWASPRPCRALEGTLEPGLAAPALHAFLSRATRNGRVGRNLRRRGNVDGRTQNLEASDNVEMFRPSGSMGLIPPSHFQARPLPTMPRMAPTWVSDLPLAHRGVSERRPDIQRPQGIMWEQDVSGDGQEPGWRDRSVELQGSQALRQQAELISRQLQELRQLEEEVRVLRETSLQQKMKLETQAMELEALARAEKAGRAEAEGLRAALAGAEVVRKNLEEGSQRELEEVQRLHQEQLSSLTRAHQEALSSLTSKAEGLEKSMTSLETSRAGEAKELAVAQREAELLREQLTKTQEDLEAQVTLVENLRRYVGEQVPPEIHSQAWESERLELLETVQHLQEDRDGLHTTAELLQVRVQSLMHILSMQEEELARKVQPSDSLEPEFSRKSQALLKRWREKVFALMVQLKAQELEHGACMQQLKGQVAEFQERVAAQSQEQAILQRSLEDKAAQVEVERMGAKSLQVELSRAQEARRRGQQQTASAEEQLKRVAKAISSFQIWLQNTVAEVEQAAARLPSLSSRVSYAVRKVHTIQGLMARKLVLAQLRQESHPQAPPTEEVSLELEQLREERNRLDAEVQLSAHIIQQEVGRAREQGEAERQQLSEVAQQLEQELRRTQESLASVGLQLEAARQGQQESTEEAASLRQELTQQQQVYGQALQEKVAEVESRLREQLSEAERRLNEARREHAKAVVSLRQMQRKATREKERNQELRRLQEEARKEEGLRLTQRLQELQRDKNLLLATLQQEGLLSHYKQQRLLAVLPPLDKGGSVQPSPRPAGPSAPAPPAAALGPRAATKESLSVLLDDLQSLSEAISKEETVSQGDNQNSPAARGSECLGAQGGPVGQEDREMG